MFHLFSHLLYTEDSTVNIGHRDYLKSHIATDFLHLEKKKVYNLCKR